MGVTLEDAWAVAERLDATGNAATERAFAAALALAGPAPVRTVPAGTATIAPAGTTPTSTRGVAGMCLSGSHAACAAITCACDCHGARR